jgi:hypothetical protein
MGILFGIENSYGLRWPGFESGGGNEFSHFLNRPHNPYSMNPGFFLERKCLLSLALSVFSAYRHYGRINSHLHMVCMLTYKKRTGNINIA